MPIHSALCLFILHYAHSLTLGASSCLCFPGTPHPPARLLGCVVAVPLVGSTPHLPSILVCARHWRGAMNSIACQARTKMPKLLPLQPFSIPLSGVNTATCVHCRHIQLPAQLPTSPPLHSATDRYFICCNTANVSTKDATTSTPAQKPTYHYHFTKVGWNTVIPSGLCAIVRHKTYPPPSYPGV